MVQSKFETFVTRQAVREAWLEFWKNGKKQTAAGIDGLTPKKFFAACDRNIDLIYKDLKRGYIFQNLKPILIEKPNGSKRIICIGTVRDRVVQRMIAGHLTSSADKLDILNNVSFGFIKSSAGVERGVIAARKQAIAYRQVINWAYKTDITAFFDNIPRDELVDMTVRSLRAPSFRKILSAAISCEIDARNKILCRIAAANGIRPNIGVRQGMPIAPLFSNIILRDFDNAIIRRGYKMVRYADDLIFLANSRDECVEIDLFVRESLAKVGLSVPAISDGTKTRISSPDQNIDFLGLSLQKNRLNNYELIITDDQFSKVKRRLGQFKDVNALLRDGFDFISLGNKLDSSIGGYRTAYSCASNAEKFDKVLEETRSEVIKSVLAKFFGMKNVDKLDEAGMKFMGINTVER